MAETKSSSGGSGSGGSKSVSAGAGDEGSQEASGGTAVCGRGGVSGGGGGGSTNETNTSSTCDATDTEREWAQAAHTEFAKGNHTAALTLLAQLHSTRPKDHKVRCIYGLLFICIVINMYGSLHV